MLAWREERTAVVFVAGVVTILEPVTHSSRVDTLLRKRAQELACATLKTLYGINERK